MKSKVNLFMRILLSFTLCLSTLFSYSQIDLEYYLPENTNYSELIPQPEEIIGHQVGEWHITHDKLVYYIRAVAGKSNRVKLIEMGKTHEDRPQILAVITSEENHNRLEEIRLEHKKLTNPAESDNVDISKLPLVLWQGFSIHGNEPSGSNAALLAAYHYAAAEGSEIDELLENVIILIDPCFNPDGLTRFSTWANSNKSKNLVTDPNNREQNEIWPRGRTNHYQFDLNRDWLPIQQPESKNRIVQFHRWKPNILTDHHEMGTNSTFFFQPGIPSRTNPNTPSRNQELTAKIGEFHAKALDGIKSLYYSKEDYDDFYYGKGSTFPDIQGSIGILFEQASSRGHAQESVHGILKFPFTIRNQFKTVLSTSEAGVALREELLEYQRSFFKEAMREASASDKKALVFGARADKNRARELANILASHEIEVFELGGSTSVNGVQFYKDKSYLVPLEQPQSRLIKSMFQEITTFEDSLFYDVSSWTLSHAFNLDHAYVGSRQLGGIDKGERFSPSTQSNFEVPESSYAYAFKWDDYYAPKLLWRLLEENVKTKVATKPFSHEGEEFPVGSIMISLQTQKMDEASLQELIERAANESQVEIYAINTGNTRGVNLGSRTLLPVEKPKIAMLVEGGISSYDAGEVWHLLDNRFDMSISQIPIRVFNRIDFDEYNVLVLVNGNYSTVSASKIAALKNWTQKGGTIIAFKSANNWLQQNEIIKLEINTPEKDSSDRKDYADLQANLGAQRTGGTIFQAELDISHPIGYGYKKRELPVFVNSNSLFETPENPYAYPLQFTSDPLMSGYVSQENLERIKEKAGIVVSKVGRGKVVSFSFNPNFRAFWYGTNKLFLNSIFFGNLIDSRSGE